MIIVLIASKLTYMHIHRYTKERLHTYVHAKIDSQWVIFSYVTINLWEYMNYS